MSTTENLSPELSVTVTKRTLKRALAISKITASRDKMLPMICAVNIALTERGNLVVQSTDRYMLSRTFLQPLDPPKHNEDFAGHGVTVPLDTVNFLEKWLPLVESMNTPVNLSYNTKIGLCVTADTSFAPSLSRLKVLDSEKYPQIGKLTRTDEEFGSEADRPGVTILGARLLNALGRIASHADARADHIALRPGKKTMNEGNDIIFRIADGDTVWCDGVLMGARTPADSEQMKHGL